MDAAIPKDSFKRMYFLGGVKQAKQMHAVFADRFKTRKYDYSRRIAPLRGATVPTAHDNGL